MLRKSSGFTLVELMIVISILGILSTIVIPQYQNFIARSQIAESIVMMNSAKLMVEDYVSSNGNFPSNKSSLINLSIRITGTYGAITGVNTPIADSGIIIYKTSEKTNKNIRNSSVWFSREANTGIWSCLSNLTVKYAPKNCQKSATTPSGS